MSKLTFQPARLVEGKSRWYIIFYAVGPKGEPWHRYRETFALNRIHHIPTRRSRGTELCEKIDWWLSTGRIAWKFNEQEANMGMSTVDGPALGNTPAVDAIKSILEIKCAGARRNSKRSYKSTYGLLIDFLEKRGWANYPIENLTKVHASAFMDSRLVAGIGNSTYNNNLSLLRGCWLALEKRGYVSKLIFKSIPKRKARPKKRRAFTTAEARIVIREAYETDYLLFLGIILQYCCYIRPVELRRLRKYNISINDKMVEVPGREAKSYEERFPAIPESFIKYFDHPFWKEIPYNYLIFGEGWQPHPAKSCSDNRMYKKHEKLLLNLQKREQLTNIVGLTWYSWKDTGISDALEQLPLVSVQDQAGHTKPEMTLRYRTKRGRNSKFQQGFKNDLL